MYSFSLHVQVLVFNFLPFIHGRIFIALYLNNYSKRKLYSVSSKFMFWENVSFGKKEKLGILIINWGEFLYCCNEFLGAFVNFCFD